MKDPKTNRQVTICAFDDYYTPVFGLVNQYLSPIFNLFFFSFLPVLIGGVQCILDMAYLRRLKREQKKFYIKLNEDHIEWTLYAYFAAYFIVLLPLFFHQVIELVLGTKKFPFVFPLFIQLKFSSAVPLVVTEMSLLFILCAADLFIWLCVDKNLKLLAKLWLKRYIFCKKSKAIKKQQITASSASSSSGSTPTPNSDNTESSSAKTSSEMCAIQDTDPAKMNLLGVGGGKMNKDSGTSSNGTNTLTSNASVIMMTNKSKKQLLLPNLTDAIKQTAAIPASIQHTSVYPYETSLEKNERNFKMIDTDIDHMCDDDYDLDNNNDIDNVNDEDIVANVYVTNEEIQKAVAVGQSMRNYKSNYENVNPPSFKTAINQLNNNSNSPGKN
jgi:hypothetical protein